MVITPRAGGLGPGCPPGQKSGAGGPLNSSRSPQSWALQLLPAQLCPTRSGQLPDGRARLEKTPAKETLPLCFPKAGTAAAVQERPLGKRVAGEPERAGELAPSPLACETAAVGRAGPCDGSCLLSATIKALEQ